VSAWLVFISIVPLLLAKNVTKCVQPVLKLVVLHAVTFMLLQAQLIISVIVRRVTISIVPLILARNVELIV